MPVPVLDQQFQLFDFKGLNINVPRDQIEENELTVAVNVLIRNGNIMKRPGMKLWASWPYSETPAAGQFGRLIFLGFFGTNVRSEFFFYDTARDSIYVSTDGINLQRRTSTTDVDQVISNLLTPRNATITTKPYIAIKDGAAFRVVTVNSFGMADAVVTPVAPCTSDPAKLMDHLDRLWIAQRDAVSFSDPGTAQWGTLGIAGGTKNTITLPDLVWDIASYQDKILILTTDNLYVLSIAGSPRNWSLQRIWSFSKRLDEFMNSESIPAGNSSAPPCAKNFVEMDGKIYFLHPEGLFQTDGASVQKLSQNVDPWFNQPANFTRSQINLSVFSYRKRELIIKMTGDIGNDVSNQIRYLIYNTLSGAWSKVTFPFGCPAGSPIFDPVFLGNNLDNIPFYTYDLVGFFHLFSSVTETTPVDIASALTAEDFNESITGTFAMTSHITNEPNKFYMFPEYESKWVYNDAGTLFQSIIETKTFDFGYRGANKKCNKAYLTVKVAAPVDITATHIVNNDHTVTRTKQALPTERLRKITGPGYFLEWALRFQDSATVGAATGGWSLESLGLDMFNKSEQHQQVGS